MGMTTYIDTQTILENEEKFHHSSNDSKYILNFRQNNSLGSWFLFIL